jgi:hypothetical protein
VAVQTADPALLQPLRGQQQVHAEAAPEPAERDEVLGEVGLGGQQLAELVDDDEQAGQGREVGAGAARGLVLAHRGEVAGRSQQLLAALHLTAQGVGEAVDQSEVVLEVGEHPRDVRQLGQPGEGRTALEVHQQEREHVGRVGGSQGHHEAAQQLALAGAGGADAEPVRAHPADRALLEVEVDEGSLGGDPYRHPEHLPVRPRRPRLRGVEGARVDAERRHQVGAVAAAAARAGRQLRRQQPPRQLLGLGDGQHVRLPPPRARGPVELQRPVRLHGQPRGHRGRLVGPRGRQRHDGRVQALGVRQHDVERSVTGTRAAGVHDDQQVRPAATGARQTALGLPGRQLGQQQLGHRLAVAVEAGLARRVARLGVAAVRQPLHPGPGRRAVGTDHHRHPEVVGGVPRRGLGQDGPCQCAGPLGRTDQAERRDSPERDGEHRVGEGPAVVSDVLGGLPADRVHLLQRPTGAPQPQRGGQASRPTAHPDHERVVVVTPPLPQPERVVGELPQRRGVRVGPGVAAPLGCGRRACGLPDLTEVLQVADPVGEAAVAGGAALGDGQRNSDADGRAGEQQAPQDEQRPRVGQDEHQRAQAADRRQRVLHPAALAGARQRRRWGDLDGGRGCGRWRCAGRPVQHRRAHAADLRAVVTAARSPAAESADSTGPSAAVPPGARPGQASYSCRSRCAHARVPYCDVTFVGWTVAGPVR